MAMDKQAASQYVDALIAKIASAMEATGVKLSAEELASLALRKIADDEEGESSAHEGGETPTEEKSEEEKEEEEKKESAAKIASAYQLLQRMDKTASTTPTTGQVPEQEKLAAFENSVVARAREFLVYGGIDPDSGKPLSKIALARTPEELRDAAAMELLEAKNYPVVWPPEYLGRALGR